MITDFLLRIQQRMRSQATKIGCIVQDSPASHKRRIHTHSCKFPQQKRLGLYNFWWARSSYLRTVERPQWRDHAHRHYYESWLRLGNRNNSRALSLCTCSFDAWPARELQAVARRCVQSYRRDAQCAKLLPPHEDH